MFTRVTTRLFLQGHVLFSDFSLQVLFSLGMSFFIEPEAFLLTYTVFGVQCCTYGLGEKCYINEIGNGNSVLVFDMI